MLKNLLAIALLAAMSGFVPDAIAADPPVANTQPKSPPSDSWNPATQPATQPVTDPVAAAKAVLDDMDAGRYDAVHARFGDVMAHAVSSDQLKSVWSALPLQYGKFLHRGTARVESGNGLTVVYVPLVYQRLSLEASIATDATGKMAGFFVRPAPPPPAHERTDLTAREVQFGPANHTELPGTLLLPKGNGPFPVVVLVHGSGPGDRDETTFGTRVFRDIAEGLADHGVASLRYEKRTKQHPMEFSRAFTIDDETTNDAVAAVAFLKTQAGIDPKRIYVVGHSQGAMMAPRIAQHAPGLAGLVLLAAPARGLQYEQLAQVEYLSTHDPVQGPTLAAKLPELRLKVDELNRIDPKLPAESPLLNNIPASYWRDLAGYDPVHEAKSLHLPILIEQGDRDYQVSAADWARWQTEFRNDPRVAIHHYPDLNHLFVAGEGPSLPTEYYRPAHVDPRVIDDIARWIKAH